MCVAAIPLITLAISAASTVATVSAQQQQAQATADAQNAYNRQSEQNAITARNANLANLEVTRNQAYQDTLEQVGKDDLARRQAQATATVAAGEAGISGLSVDALLRDLAGQAGYDNATAYENYLRTDQRINVARENTQNNYESGLNSIRQPQIQSPNWLGAGLKIGQSALDSYSMYKTNLAKQQT
jgi:hypothetical protein